MFLFTFTVITLSIIGLFFQLVLALAASFAAQQVSMGQQVWNWQAMAVEDACSTDKGVNADSTVTDANFRANILAQRATYNTSNWWDTVIAQVNYGTANTRVVITYIPPGTSFQGFTSAEISRQIRAAPQNTSQLSSVKSGAVTVSYKATGATTFTITGLPAEVAVDGTNVIVTTANCP